VNYLVHEWFRLTTESVDRKNKNQSRAEVLPLLHEVQKAFEAWAGGPTGCPLEPLNLADADITQLLKQAYGVIKAAAEYQGKKNLSRETFLSYAANGLELVSHGRNNTRQKH